MSIVFLQPVPFVDKGFDKADFPLDAFRNVLDARLAKLFRTVKKDSVRIEKRVVNLREVGLGGVVRRFVFRIVHMERIADRQENARPFGLFLKLFFATVGMGLAVRSSYRARLESFFLDSWHRKCSRRLT